MKIWMPKPDGVGFLLALDEVPHAQGPLVAGVEAVFPARTRSAPLFHDRAPDASRGCTMRWFTNRFTVYGAKRRVGNHIRARRPARCCSSPGTSSSRRDHGERQASHDHALGDGIDALAEDCAPPARCRDSTRRFCATSVGDERPPCAGSMWRIVSCSKPTPSRMRWAGLAPMERRPPPPEGRCPGRRPVIASG